MLSASGRLIWKEQYGLEVPGYGETYPAACDGLAVGETLLVHGIDSPEWMEVPGGEEDAGDAVLMSGLYKINGRWRKADMHVGLVLQPGMLIHVERGIDASLAAYRSDRRIVHRVRGFYRHQNLL